MSQPLRPPSTRTSQSLQGQILFGHELKQPKLENPLVKPCILSAMLCAASGRSDVVKLNSEVNDERRTIVLELCRCLSHCLELTCSDCWSICFRMQHKTHTLHSRNF